MLKNLKLALLAIVALLIANEAYANPCPPGNPPTNCGPPVGNVVFDGINHQPVPHVYTPYTTNPFTATQAMTNVTFAFREDPAFLELDNVTMFDVTTGTAVPVTNGNFELGIVGGQPVDWTYLNNFGATFGGVVQAGCGVLGSNCYFDGAVQAYDAITHSITTTIGDIYTVSFQLNDNGPLNVFSQLSTNGDVTDTGAMA